MSINVTIRPQGVTSGGDSRPVDGIEGDINTTGEAEIALSLVGTSGGSVVLNAGTDHEDVYNRDRLLSIREGRGSNGANPVPAAATATEGTGVGHAIALEGQYAGGLGDVGHSGGGARLTYRPSIPVATGPHRIHIEPIIGADIAAMGMNGQRTTPGGETVSSSFTRFGGVLGLDGRYLPPVADHRLSITFGARVGFGGFTTPASTIVNLPATCTPDALGRGECEPNAGPRTGNAGTTGLYNPRFQNARGTSGTVATVSGALGVGFAVLRGGWGNLSVFGTVEAGYVALSPSDGNGIGFPFVSGLLGIRVGFGGGESQVAGTPPAAEPTVDRATLAEQPAAGEAWNVDDLLRSQLPAGARISSVAFDGTALQGPPYVVPAASMTAGAHTLRATYRMPGDAQDRVREISVRVATPETPTDNAPYQTEFAPSVNL